ncbi:hypothetical protein [Desulfosporosinus sp. FKA]|uniref:hypothetical protein n=1 Tax=Desulfosporosinus sp. FKA TaxID=1969834 RepID=UPI000B498F1F|nr:hypothetical protein [Desulfosporosinus sp. FKA]
MFDKNNTRLERGNKVRLKIGFNERGLGVKIDNIIDDLIEERLYEIAYQKSIDNPEYGKLNKELIDMEDKIKSSMGLDFFSGFEDKLAYMNSINFRKAYRRGFIDGFKKLLKHFMLIKEILKGQKLEKG